MSAAISDFAVGGTPAKPFVDGEHIEMQSVVPPTPATPGMAGDARCPAGSAVTPLAPVDTTITPPATVGQGGKNGNASQDSGAKTKESRKRKLEFRQQSPAADPDFETPVKPALTERQQLALLLKGQTPESLSRAESVASNAIACTSPAPQAGMAVLKDKKVNQRNRLGETLLQRAAIKGDVAQVRRLLSQGAEVNTHDNAGWTPLHEAANHGHVDVAEALLQAGAQPNAKGMGGETPLHDAVVNNHMPIVRLLIRYGADISQLNDDDESALDKCEDDSLMRKYLEAKLVRGARRALLRGKENSEPNSKPSISKTTEDLANHAVPISNAKQPLAPSSANRTASPTITPGSSLASTPLKHTSNQKELTGQSGDKKPKHTAKPQQPANSTEAEAESTDVPAASCPAQGVKPACTPSVSQTETQATAQADPEPMKTSDDSVYKSKDKVQRIVISKQQLTANKQVNLGAQPKPARNLEPKKPSPSATLPISKTISATTVSKPHPAAGKPTQMPTDQLKPSDSNSQTSSGRHVETAAPVTVPAQDSTMTPVLPASSVHQHHAIDNAVSEKPHEGEPAAQTVEPAQAAPCNTQPTKAPTTTDGRRHKKVIGVARAQPKPKAAEANSHRKRDSLLALAEQLDAERELRLAKRRKMQGSAETGKDIHGLPAQLATLHQEMMQERIQLERRLATERSQFAEMAIGQAQQLAACIPDNWVEGPSAPRIEAVAGINVSGHLRGTSACRFLTKKQYGCLAQSNPQPVPMHAVVTNLIQAAGELRSKQQLESATLHRRHEEEWKYQTSLLELDADFQFTRMEVPSVAVAECLFHHLTSY